MVEWMVSEISILTKHINPADWRKQKWYSCCRGGWRYLVKVDLVLAMHSQTRLSSMFGYGPEIENTSEWNNGMDAIIFQMDVVCVGKSWKLTLTYSSNAFRKKYGLSLEIWLIWIMFQNYGTTYATIFFWV